jgi:sec-independent protein translocase protein TatB
MFDIGWTELLLIAVVAIVVIGPKDLPRAMRAVGHWTGKVKRMAGDFQRQFNEALREADLGDVKKEVDRLGRLDPMADLRKDLSKVGDGIRADLKKVDTGIKTGLGEPEAAKAAPAVTAAATAVAEVAASPAIAPPPAPAMEPAPIAAGDVKS